MLKLRAQEIPLHSIKEFHGLQGSHVYLFPAASQADWVEALQFLQIDPRTTCQQSISEAGEVLKSAGRMSVIKLWKEPE